MLKMSGEGGLCKKYDNILKQDDIKVWLAAEKIQFYSLLCGQKDKQTNNVNQREAFRHKITANLGFLLSNISQGFIYCK